MSYKRRKKSDSLNEYFTALADFNVVSENLLKVTDIDAFIVWFEKLWTIDPRALFFFVRKNKGLFAEEWIEWAQAHYKRKF